jgi:hypothetical protein
MKQAALIGADVATAPPGVIKAMANHVLTDKGLDGFLKDWEKTGQKILPGFIDQYVSQGRDVPRRSVTLRQVSDASPMLFGSDATWIQSEAVLTLDLGAGRLPGLLVMGAEDPHQFRPSQGTDLLMFFGGVFERLMQRWLD